MKAYFGWAAKAADVYPWAAKGDRGRARLHVRCSEGEHLPEIKWLGPLRMPLCIVATQHWIDIKLMLLLNECF